MLWVTQAYFAANQLFARCPHQIYEPHFPANVEGSWSTNILDAPLVSRAHQNVRPPGIGYLAVFKANSTLATTYFWLDSHAVLSHSCVYSVVDSGKYHRMRRTS